MVNYSNKQTIVGENHEHGSDIAMCSQGFGVYERLSQQKMFGMYVEGRAMNIS